MPHTAGLQAPGSLGAAVLDGPPPTPRLERDPERPPTSLADLAGPPTQDAGIPVLKGMVDLGQQMAEALDSYVAAGRSLPVPIDLSREVLLTKTALQRILAKLLESGAPSLSPTAAGANFPAGGLVPAGPSAP